MSTAPDQSASKLVGLAIRDLSARDPSTLSAAFAAIGWQKPASLFEAYVDECQHGQRVALVAELDSEVAGYGTVVWHSQYNYFKERQIPEIKDLNVLPGFRRRGIGTALMDALESTIAERSTVAGIGVGLYTGYGPAQRMYILRGYVPDGRGAFHGDQPLAPGEAVPVDDALVLYMIKQLAPRAGSHLP